MAVGNAGLGHPFSLASDARSAEKLLRGEKFCNAKAKAKGKAKAKARRQFTLQLKAFSQMEDAEKLAGQMRSNGHSMRVDSADVKGRTWHRVRLGTYTSWNEAVTAKSAFEKKENIIAYVMAM